MRSIGNFARLLGAAAFLAAPTLAAAMEPQDFPDGQAALADYQPEVLDDPYMPNPPPRAGGVRTIIVRGPYVSVQANVDAGGNNIPGDAANEPSIAVDPTNPNRMVIGWRQFDTISSNFRQAGRAYSHDGGQSWTFPGVLTPGTFRSDPVMEADSAGNFYYNTLRNTFQCEVFKSVDGGVTWLPQVFAYGGDKQWMAIDRTGGMGDGHLYQVWNPIYGCCGAGSFNRSVDGNASWGSPLIPPDDLRWGTVTVGPDGEVYVIGTSNFTAQIAVMRSDNAQDSGVTPTFNQFVNVDLGGTQGGGRRFLPTALGGAEGSLQLNIARSGGCSS